MRTGFTFFSPQHSSRLSVKKFYKLLRKSIPNEPLPTHQNNLHHRRCAQRHRRSFGTGGNALEFYHYNFWFVVLAMGIGYAIVARNPAENRGLILIGAIGKLIASVQEVLCKR
jgi:hypothetical protein